jgi:hypothetical protein
MLLRCPEAGKFRRELINKKQLSTNGGIAYKSILIYTNKAPTSI